MDMARTHTKNGTNEASNQRALRWAPPGKGKEEDHWEHGEEPFRRWMRWERPGMI